MALGYHAALKHEEGSWDDHLLLAYDSLLAEEFQPSMCTPNVTEARRLLSLLKTSWVQNSELEKLMQESEGDQQERLSIPLQTPHAQAMPTSCGCSPCACHRSSMLPKLLLCVCQCMCVCVCEYMCVM